jgi:uncharacterized protein YdeI (YjbR/CyaY-like superfamily)
MLYSQRFRNMGVPAMKARFFKDAIAFRQWLAAHHQHETELLVGFHKRDSGKASMTWPESVDEALCVGWIDGVRKSLDELSYTIRFTPRKATSTWSAVNIKRVQVLTEQGRMLPAGLAAFAARQEKKSVVYAYEQVEAVLAPEYLALLNKNKAASTFFAAQAPWYRKKASWWVMSAKKEDTQLRRLEKLIACCKSGELV